MNLTTTVHKQEQEANRFCIRCLWCLQIGFALTLLLTILDIFDLETNMAEHLYLFSILGCLLPTFLMWKFHTETKSWMKFLILFELVIMITILAGYYGVHSVLLLAVPLLISCHYYSRSVLIYTYCMSLVGFSIGIVVGYQYSIGEFQNLSVDFPAFANGLDLFESFLIPTLLLYTFLFPIAWMLVDRAKRTAEENEARAVQQQKEKSELEMASRIQNSMLPKFFPSNDAIAIDASMKPAREVGGDFYDVVTLDETHVAILVGDVCGKGFSAALFMVLCKNVLHEELLRNPIAEAVFQQANTTLCHNNDSNQFATCWLGIYDLESHILSYVDAGHDTPYLVHQGSMQELKPRVKRLPLAAMEKTQYEGNTISLTSGDRILLYTDGVTEAHRPGGQLFGEARLKESFQSHCDANPEEILLGIQSDISTYIEGAPPYDDITMLVMEVK